MKTVKEVSDGNWKKQKMKLTGWTAQICQHEIDHLNGIIVGKSEDADTFRKFVDQAIVVETRL